MTTDTWLVVGGLVALAGASLAVRGVGELVGKPAQLVVYVLAMVVAGFLGWHIAEDIEASTGPLGVAAGLAMVEAAPWVFALAKGLVARKVK